MKNRFFSLLNIVGLAIGLACFLLITLYVSQELSYDRYHEKADRIYRINADILIGGTNLKLAVSSDPMGATLKKDYPEIEQFTRIYASGGSKLVKKGNLFIRENQVAHVDSTFFEVFSFPALEGNVHTALNEPNTVVITESAARKYFGTTRVVGKTIETDDQPAGLYKITAVIKDMPENSHFRYDFLFSMDNVDYGFGNYLSHNFATYLLFKPGTDTRTFEKKFPDYINRYVLPKAMENLGVKSMEDFEKSGNYLRYSLIPITDIHLHSDRSAELSPNSSIQYIYVFSAIAIFILLIACVNFMNLSTARSANRAKEVGIRKVLGSERSFLIRQFLTESTLLTTLAMLIAIGLLVLSLPYFNQLSGKHFELQHLYTSWFLLFLVIAIPVIGVLAGIYPAFYLSAFQPIKVLKGKLQGGARSSWLRNLLVVFQFATSIILIVGTIIVYQQLSFIQHTKIGFNKDQVLVVEGTGSLNNNYRAFRHEIEKLAGVKGSASAGFLPVSNSARNSNAFSKEPMMTEKNSFNMQCWRIDEQYIPLMGMEMKEGRNFSKEFISDSAGIIINEATEKLLGYAQPIGQKIYAMDEHNALVPYTIIGVVKDFHFESMRQNIEPLAMRLGEANWATSFKVEAGAIGTLLPQIAKRWRELAPDLPFQYEFLDEAFSQMYAQEQQAGKIVLSFSILAIIIACLGLFGLASYMAEQRTKEIGVRKVLGASVENIVTMLTRDFIRLVLIAACIALPLGWLLMHRWLLDFAYRINIHWWVFLLATLLALLIAIFTISFQSIRAALQNPVKSLRSE